METLEPLLSAVRTFLEAAGWRLSGIQKTTSYEYEGPWEGNTLRSAYAFFHRETDEGDLGPSIEAFVDEADDGVDAALSLVLAGPLPADEPNVLDLLRRAITVASRALPVEMAAPVTVSFAHPGRGMPEGARTKVRFKAQIPSPAVDAGERAVNATLATIESAFRAMLEEWPEAPDDD